MKMRIWLKICCISELYHIILVKIFRLNSNWHYWCINCDKVYSSSCDYWVDITLLHNGSTCSPRRSHQMAASGWGQFFRDHHDFLAWWLAELQDSSSTVGIVHPSPSCSFGSLLGFPTCETNSCGGMPSSSLSLPLPLEQQLLKE